jgi:hypothetical protein
MNKDREDDRTKWIRTLPQNDCDKKGSRGTSILIFNSLTRQEQLKIIEKLAVHSQDPFTLYSTIPYMYTVDRKYISSVLGEKIQIFLGKSARNFFPSDITKTAWNFCN